MILKERNMKKPRPFSKPMALNTFLFQEWHPEPLFPNVRPSFTNLTTHSTFNTFHKTPASPMANDTNQLVDAYNNFYTGSEAEWRMLGAKSKAKNLTEVCKGIRPSKILEVGAGDGSILHYLSEWNFGDELYALEIAERGVSIIK